MDMAAPALSAGAVAWPGPVRIERPGRVARHGVARDEHGSVNPPVF